MTTATPTLQGLAEQLELNPAHGTLMTKSRSWLPGARGEGRGSRAKETRELEECGDCSLS